MMNIYDVPDCQAKTCEFGCGRLVPYWYELCDKCEAAYEQMVLSEEGFDDSNWEANVPQEGDLPF